MICTEATRLAIGLLMPHGDHITIPVSHCPRKAFPGL